MSGPLYIGNNAEGNYAADFLKWEEENRYSRAVGTLDTTAAVDLPAGTVLEGALTAMVEWAGTNPITGILLEHSVFAITETPSEAVIIVRDAIVDARGLNWGGGAGDAADIAQLMSNLPGVVVREGA